jgi:hypothetical protein
LGLFDNNTALECFSNSLHVEGASSSTPPDTPPPLKDNVKRRQNSNLRLTFKSRERKSIYQLQYPKHIAARGQH